jgi:hypothetical protein
MIDFGKMARDPEGKKLLRGGFKDILEGWKDEDPDDPQLQDTETLADELTEAQARK